MKETEDQTVHRSSGVLTKEEILERLGTENNDLRLFFTPMIDQNSQVGPSTLDIRLGTQFIIFRRTMYPILDVCEDDEKTLDWKIGAYQEKIYKPLGQRLVLHPQQLVLGCTLEYIKLPSDLIAEVIGRSSWGRLGLIISAATVVHPCYAGVITLELANEGDTPLALYPGIRIAQLIFYKLARTEEKSSISSTKYTCSVEPSFSRLHKDEDLKAIRNLKKKRESHV